MNGDPLNAAIALGCRVAEKSALGKRVLTFSSSPVWVNLEEYNTFTDMVDKLHNADWGANTDIYKAFELILDAIEQSKNTLEYEEIEQMTFVIFSDMQIDSADSTFRKKNTKSLFENISQLYAERGIKLTGTPFKPPHLLFWNLRSLSGTPVLSSEENVSTMSGFSPALLNLYCEKGLDALKSYTPWTMLLGALSNKRYHTLGDKIIEILL